MQVGIKIVDENGTARWYKDADCTILHKEDGPAVAWVDGEQSWWFDGDIHRTNGPAVLYADGSKFWYQNGQFHRTDGPAVEWADGTKEWWLNGVQLTEAEFLANKQRTKAKQVCCINTLTTWNKIMPIMTDCMFTNAARWLQDCSYEFQDAIYGLDAPLGTPLVQDEEDAAALAELIKQTHNALALLEAIAERAPKVAALLAKSPV